MSTCWFYNPFNMKSSKDNERCHNKQTMQGFSIDSNVSDSGAAAAKVTAGIGAEYTTAQQGAAARHENSAQMQLIPHQLSPDSSHQFPASHPISASRSSRHCCATGTAVQAISRQVAAPSCHTPSTATAAATAVDTAGTALGANTGVKTAACSGDAMRNQSQRYKQHMWASYIA